MADKDFVVKNGLVVNSSFATDGTQITINSINSTSNGFFTNSTSIKIGNSTVNATINSTSFTGSVNNATYFNGQLASYYLTTTGTAADSSKLGGVAAASYVNSTSLTTTLAGYVTTTGTSYDSVRLGGVAACNYLTNTGTAYDSSRLGGALATNYITSTSLNTTLAGYVTTTGTAYDSARLGNQLATYYVNSSSLSSTLGGYVTTSGTAADSYKLGGLAAAGYVNSTSLNSTLTGYLTTSGQAYDSARLGGQPASTFLNTSGAYIFTGAHIHNSTLAVNSSVFTLANSQIVANSGYGAAGQYLTSAGTGSNVYWSSGLQANNTGGTGALQYYNGSTTTSFNSGLGLVFSAASNTLSVANSIQLGGTATVNGTVFTGVSNYANDSSYLGGVSATNYLTSSALTTRLGNYPLKTDTFFIGTTSIAHNRISGTQTLTGVSIDGNATNITAAYTGVLSFNQITAALGYTPYNATNPSGFTATPGTVTRLSATTPLSVTNPTTTPEVTIAQAGTSTSGYLSAADWTTFNNKQALLPAATSSASGYLTSTDWTTFNNKQAALSVANATSSGYITYTDWNTFNNKQAPLSPASSTINGYLTSVDWNTFNNKQAPLPYAATNADGKLSAADWNTFNGKMSNSYAAVIAALGFTPAATAASITSSTITTALGYTPYNSTNPSGYVTSASLSGYVPNGTLAFLAYRASPAFSGGVYNSGYYYQLNQSSGFGINCSLGNYFTVSGSGTFSFSGQPGSGYVYGMIIRTVGAGSLGWPSTVRWAGNGSAPTPSGGNDIWVFITDDGGSNWRGSLAMKNAG